MLFLVGSGTTVRCPDQGAFQRLSISPNGRYAVVTSVVRGPSASAAVFDAVTGSEYFRIGRDGEKGSGARWFCAHGLRTPAFCDREKM
ncbi:hypothetical protein WJX73_002566 [Symbiochloris irregularis]|uniref:Uncharacterized protein n=1 Tax=Symbiochloris irregularis TaxID=706552 RepID=A0AAW1NPT3_9CHLO